MRSRAPFLRLTLIPLLLLTLSAGCSRAQSSEPAPAAHAAAQAPATPTGGTSVGGAPSLLASESSAPVHKIIRTAQLRVEADDPAAVQHRATEIAEQLGGFVVSSESRRSGPGTAEAPSTEVELTMRVPAERFATAIDRLRAAAGRVVDEKVAGQDVTEEYIDLEATLRAKRAMETQFLEILKGARAVKDALDVQERLGEVRGEIEKVEGRRRFLENQSALSTITMDVEPTKPLVSTSSLGVRDTFQKAGADLVNVSIGILTFGVRATAWLVPFLALVAAPLYAAMRLVRKLRRRTPAGGVARAEAT